MEQQARNPHWVQTLQALVSALPGLLSDRLQLLALELQRAGRGIVQIVALVLLAAVLAITAWLALWACVALLLVTLGLPWPLAMLAVLLVNGLLAVAVLVWIRRLVATVGLPATRRHLVFGVGVGAGVGAGAGAADSGHARAQPFFIPPTGRP